MVCPDSGNAHFPGKVAFALGFAGFNHPGIFFRYEYGIAIAGNNTFFLRFFGIVKVDFNNKSSFHQTVWGAISKGLGERLIP